MLTIQTIEVVNLVGEQITNQVFFIDWERSRGFVMPKTGEPPSAPSPNLGSHHHPDQHHFESRLSSQTPSPITIWRTYFVANEWNELQDYRKTSLFFQLMAMILFLKVRGVRPGMASEYCRLSFFRIYTK